MYAFKPQDSAWASPPAPCASLQGGANGISYLDGASQGIATSPDGAVTVYLTRPGEQITCCPSPTRALALCSATLDLRQTLTGCIT